MQSSSAEFFDDRDDADLLARARSGDTRSADVLWIRVRPSVLGVARSITGNQHDAEDLASEAMTKVFAAIADGQGPSESVLPYLYATMRNLHISMLRRQARVGTPLELDEQRVLNLVTEEPDAIESELVTQAFKALPDRWRHVLWASLVEGRHGNEIADELCIKPAAVHALKSRALEGLRQGYLSEHAKRSEEQECAAVHRVLASIARGRSRRSTDLNQVWRHLRGCEHCAEGYREITAINNRIGALLGPAAAATVVGILPHLGGATTIGVIKVPAAAGKLVAAAGVAGVLAIAGTTLTLGTHDDKAPAPQTSVAAPADAPSAAEPTVVPARAAARAATTPATPKAPAAATASCATLGIDGIPPLTPVTDLRTHLPVELDPATGDLVTDTCTPIARKQQPVPAAPADELDTAETLNELPAAVEKLVAPLRAPLATTVPAVPVEPRALLQP